jgi:hypothetical protein
MTNWDRGEGLNPDTFINMRHPRTMIGVESDGTIWMAAVDGRQPDHSIGMTLPDHTPEGERPHPTPAPRLHNGRRGGHANAPRPHPTPPMRRCRRSYAGC